MPHDCEAFFLTFFDSVYILRFDLIYLLTNLKKDYYENTI